MWTVDRMMSVWVTCVYEGVLIAGCRWSAFRWLWSGECYDQWLRWLWRCGNPDINPSSRGGSWRPRAATGAATASGFRTIRKRLWNSVNSVGSSSSSRATQDLFRSVSIPVYETNEQATPSPHIQNVPEGWSRISGRGVSGSAGPGAYEKNSLRWETWKEGWMRYLGGSCSR